MEPITLRLPEELAEELTAEAHDHDCRSRSEYIRRLLRNRSEYDAYSERTQSDYATTDDLERLEDRVDALENAITETADEQPSADQHQTVEPRESDAEEATPDVVEWARDNEPVSKADLLKWAAPRVDIKPDSWWERHGRGELRDHGAEFTRNVGWQFTR